MSSSSHSSIYLENRKALSLVCKVFIEEDLRFGTGREFHSAGPGTSNILFPNCKSSLLTTNFPFEAERNPCLDSSAAIDRLKSEPGWVTSVVGVGDRPSHLRRAILGPQRWPD